MCSCVILWTPPSSRHSGHFCRVAHASWEHTPWPHGSSMFRIGAVSQAQHRLMTQTGAVVVPYWLMMMSSSSSRSSSQVAIRAVASASRIVRALLLSIVAVRVWVVGVSCMFIKILVHCANFPVRLLWTSRSRWRGGLVGVAAVCVTSGAASGLAILDKV